MLLGERNLDFIRMRRRGNVVIGHVSDKQQDKGEQLSGTLYHIVPDRGGRSSFMPEGLAAPFGNNSPIDPPVGMQQTTTSPS